MLAELLLVLSVLQVPVGTTASDTEQENGESSQQSDLLQDVGQVKTLTLLLFEQYFDFSRQVREDMESIQEDLASMKQDLGSLKQEIGTVVERLDNIEEKQGKMEQKIQELANLRQTDTEELAMIQGNVGSIESCCAEVQESKKEVRQDIAALTNQTVKLTLKHSVNTKQFQSTVTKDLSFLKDTMAELTIAHAPVSCKQLIERNPGTPSGSYWITNQDRNRTQVYCDMTRQCCNSTRGWMRVAHLNMTDHTHQCPEGFRLATQVKRLCERIIVPNCTSININVHNVLYSKVCGKVIGYQYGRPRAFTPYWHHRHSIDAEYVDGVSITHGGRPRKHIWTFAAGIHHEHKKFVKCPCDVDFIGVVPPFIGDDYFCDKGSGDQVPSGQFYGEDPLWDGSGCGPTSSCCTFNSPPWFCKDLPQPTTDDIEVRVCTNGARRESEDILLQHIELYVQ